MAARNGSAARMRRTTRPDRELVFKEEGQEYAQVTRMLGDGRLEAASIDGRSRICHIRGSMHKKVWVVPGQIVLLGLRDFQDDKADVIHRYNDDEARLLRAYGELPANFGDQDDNDGGGNTSNVITFEEIADIESI